MLQVSRTVIRFNGEFIILFIALPLLLNCFPRGGYIRQDVTGYHWVMPLLTRLFARNRTLLFEPWLNCPCVTNYDLCLLSVTVTNVT